MNKINFPLFSLLLFKTCHATPEKTIKEEKIHSIDFSQQFIRHTRLLKRKIKDKKTEQKNIIREFLHKSKIREFSSINTLVYFYKQRLNHVHEDVLRLFDEYYEFIIKKIDLKNKESQQYISKLKYLEEINEKQHIEKEIFENEHKQMEAFLKNFEQGKTNKNKDIFELNEKDIENEIAKIKIATVGFWAFKLDNIDIAFQYLQCIKNSINDKIYHIGNNFSVINFNFIEIYFKGLDSACNDLFMEKIDYALLSEKELSYIKEKELQTVSDIKNFALSKKYISFMKEATKLMKFLKEKNKENSSQNRLFIKKLKKIQEKQILQKEQFEEDPKELKGGCQNSQKLLNRRIKTLTRPELLEIEIKKIKKENNVEKISLNNLQNILNFLDDIENFIGVTTHYFSNGFFLTEENDMLKICQEELYKIYSILSEEYNKNPNFKINFDLFKCRFEKVDEYISHRLTRIFLSLVHD